MIGNFSPKHSPVRACRALWRLDEDESDSPFLSRKSPMKEAVTSSISLKDFVASQTEVELCPKSSTLLQRRHRSNLATSSRSADHSACADLKGRRGLKLMKLTALENPPKPATCACGNGCSGMPSAECACSLLGSCQMRHLSSKPSLFQRRQSCHQAVLSIDCSVSEGPPPSLCGCSRCGTAAAECACCLLTNDAAVIRCH